MSENEERKPFWMVWNPRGRAPAVRHGDEQSARTEVERLAQLEPGPIYLLAATAVAQRQTPPVEWEELSAEPESPEDSRKVPMYGPPPLHLQLEQRNRQLQLENERLKEQVEKLQEPDNHPTIDGPDESGRLRSYPSCRRCLRVPCRCDWSELERRPKDEHRV